MTELVVASVEINKNRKGWNVLDVPANQFIKKAAEFFKEKNLIKLPKWGSLVKCGHANELPPLDPDWFFHKAASICRIIYVSKSTNVGVGTLKSQFGKKKRRGVKPPKFTKAGGKVIREVLSQLKKNGYIENYATDNNRTLGLVLTKQGRTELDKIATRIVKKN